MHKKIRRAVMAIVFLAIVLAPIVWAATTAKTTFVFYVATSRSITATYGGNCTASAFFFNETDANYDPDIDGNGSRVKPSGQRVTGFTLKDENFVGITSPSSTYSAYGGFSDAKPPAANNVPVSEINNVGYTNIANDDTSYVTRETSIDGNAPILRTMFALGVDRLRVKDLNFFFKGQSSYVTSPAVCTAGATGTGRDMNVYIWNFNSGAYDYFVGSDLAGITVGPGDQNVYGLFSRDVRNGNILNYISSDGNVIIITMGHTQSGGDKSCFTADQVKLFVTYVPETSSYCQSSTLAPLTITNAGNVDINVDANFSSAFVATDYNAVLKVWQGSAGCGSDGNGLGGWQQDCTYYSPVDVNTAPTTTSCRQYFKAQAAQYGRVVTQLTAESTQQLCFSGDFNGFVPAGDHNNTFNNCSQGGCSIDVTDSLLGWWKFNEGSGATLQDSTIYNNDGTLSNTPTWMSGASCAGGGCLDFNALQSEYVGFPIGIDFNFGNADKTTITFWMKSDLPGSPPQFVMGMGPAGDVRPFNVGIPTNANKLEFGLQPESGYWSGGFWSDDANLNGDGWHHYALAYNTDDFDANLYVDGVKTSAFGQGAVSGILQTSGTAALFFGTWDDGSGNPDNKYFDGRLDDVRFYSRTLTPNEIRAVMSHPQ